MQIEKLSFNFIYHAHRPIICHDNKDVVVSTLSLALRTTVVNVNTATVYVYSTTHSFSLKFSQKQKGLIHSIGLFFTLDVILKLHYNVMFAHPHVNTHRRAAFRNQ